MLLKNPCAEGLVLSLGTYRRVVTLLGDGVQQEEGKPLETCQEGDTGMLVPSSPFSLLPVATKQAASLTFSPSCTVLKEMGQLDRPKL